MDVSRHHDAIVDGDPKQGDETNPNRGVHFHACDRNRDHACCKRNRDGGKDRGCDGEVSEAQIEQEKINQHRQWNEPQRNPVQDKSDAILNRVNFLGVVEVEQRAEPRKPQVRFDLVLK